MWSDAAREASAEARKKASGHNAGKGNRKIAKHVKDQHDQHKSVLGGVVKGALIGSIVPGVGTVAGALIGGAARISHNSAVAKNDPRVKAAIRKADKSKKKGK